MIVKDNNGAIVLRPGTHEPLVVESRDASRPWFALPDAFGKLAAEREANPVWDWNPRYQTFMDGMITRVQCWKCGVTRWVQYWSSKSERFRRNPAW